MSLNQGRAPYLGLLFLSLGLAEACDAGDTKFAASVAPGFSGAGHAVSVLGLFKDGTMSSEGLEAFAPYLSQILGSETCEIGYSALRSSSPPVADAIDEVARTDGPSEDLLAQLAPASKGDLILVFGFAGRVPRRGHAPDAGTPGRPPYALPPMSRGGGRGMRGVGRSGGQGRTQAPADTNALDLSASFYSVSERRSVVEVAMEYSGPSAEEALREFAAKLARLLPQARCAAWNSEVNLDAEKIRQSVEE
jgi:hypothetical protein